MVHLFSSCTVQHRWARNQIDSVDRIEHQCGTQHDCSSCSRIVSFSYPPLDQTDVVSILVGLPFLVKETNITPVAIGSAVVLGVFQVGLVYVLMCIGLKTTPPVTASLISGIEPVLNPILVALFHHETIGYMALIGAVIVVAAVVWYNIEKGKSLHS